MATKPKMKPRARGVEWVGGCFESASYVLQPEPFKPVVALWMEGEVVLATEAVHPDERDAAFERALRQALAAPMVGPPRAPARVRVEDEAMAKVARRVLGPRVPVVVDDTPEIYEVADAMDEATEEREERGYLADRTVTPAAVGELFRAAAALYRAAPWGLVPDDSVVFGVDAPALGVAGGAAVVLGQAGLGRAVILFEGFKDYQAFRSATEDGAGDELPGVAVFGLDYEHDVPPELRAEVSEHGWELPLADLYPVLRHIDPDAIPRPLLPRDLQLAGALAAALTRLVADAPERLGAAAGPAVAATVDGLTLTLPHPAAVASRFEAKMTPQREVRVRVRRFLASELRGRVPGVWRDTADPFVDALLRRRITAKGSAGFDRWPARLVHEAVGDVVHRLEDARDLQRVVDVSDRFFAWMASTGQMPAALAGELHAHVEAEVKVLTTAVQDPAMRALAERIATLDEGDAARAIEDWARDVAEGRMDVPEVLRRGLGAPGPAPEKKPPAAKKKPKKG